MTELKLYNTLTRSKERFEPIDKNNVRLYVCGPTVYDFAHIGNARPVIVFDVLFRLLRHLYGEDHVTYVRNITDVDDKINARAAERGIPIRELTEQTFAQYQEDTRALGCLNPTHQPRATDYINAPDQTIDMVRMITTLIARGHAYEAEGHVLFDVASMPAYGKLSNRTMDDMIAGARVEVAPFKRNSADFVLWKPSSPSIPGWDSPWGRGRPGWHIECSAMSTALLGETFDIHGGGLDLIFPHHENEIAQSCCAHGTAKMANVFMHNGFLQMEGEKMSKSTGNFATIRDVLKDWPAEVVRLTMLKTHYRQPIDWTLSSLKESNGTLRTWARIWASNYDKKQIDIEAQNILCEDINTPALIAWLHQIYRLAEEGDGVAARKLTSTLQGLGFSNLFNKMKGAPGLTTDDKIKINAIVQQRLDARAAKNWAESDRIRDELAAMGIVIKDNKDGTTTWDVK